MTQTIDVHKEFASYFEGVEALAYALSKSISESHICLDMAAYKDFLEAAEEHDDKYIVSPEVFLAQCKEASYVSANADAFKPFVIHNEKAYLQRYFYYETCIIDNLKRLTANGNFRIITGGPGTGKTYSVATELVKLYAKNPTLKVALSAPTGKAGARMNESIKNFATNPNNNISDEIAGKLTSLQASTLQRLLGYIRNSVFFIHDAKNPLAYDVVVKFHKVVDVS